MKHWLYPANLKLFDVISAFTNEKNVAWPMSSKVKSDDKVYLYCGVPLKQITFVCEVLEINLPFELIEEQALKYVKTPSNKKPTHKSFMLLKVTHNIKINQASDLSFSALKEHGLKGSIMGPQNLNNNPTLLSYIRQFAS